MHGGSVRASSGGEGRGSEFVIRLPALPDDDVNRATRRHHTVPRSRPPAPASWSSTTTSMPPRACGGRCRQATRRRRRPRRRRGVEAANGSSPTWSCWTSICRGWMGWRSRVSCARSGSGGRRPAPAAGGDDRARPRRGPRADEAGGLRPSPGQTDRSRLAGVAADRAAGMENAEGARMDALRGTWEAGSGSAKRRSRRR